MLISLLNGKVINVPASLYLELTDEEWAREYEELMAFNFGDDDSDIWRDSIIRENPGKKDKIKKVDPDTVDSETEPEVLDLLDLDSMEKLLDMDLPESMD